MGRGRSSETGPTGSYRRGAAGGKSVHALSGLAAARSALPLVSVSAACAYHNTSCASAVPLPAGERRAWHDGSQWSRGIRKELSLFAGRNTPPQLQRTKRRQFRPPGREAALLLMLSEEQRFSIYRHRIVLAERVKNSQHPRNHGQKPRDRPGPRQAGGGPWYPRALLS